MGSAKATCTDPIPHPCEIVVLYQKHHYPHRGLPFALQAWLTFITFICGASLSHMHAITTRPQLFSPLLLRKRKKNAMSSIYNVSCLLLRLPLLLFYFRF